MKRIGLTGGIGSGKSTVTALLRERGVSVIDADVIARETVAPGSPVLAELARAFGEDIIRSDGTLDRQGLAARAFADRQATETLNAITHPAIERRTQELFDQAEATGEPLVIWDMPLLVDKGYHEQMDGVIVVDVAVDERVRRLRPGRRTSNEALRHGTIHRLQAVRTFGRRITGLDRVAGGGGHGTSPIGERLSYGLSPGLFLVLFFNGKIPLLPQQRVEIGGVRSDDRQALHRKGGGQKSFGGTVLGQITAAFRDRRPKTLRPEIEDRTD